MNAAATTTSISAPTTSFGTNGMVTVTVAAASQTAGTPTGNVSLTVDAGSAVSQALMNGSTTFTVSNLNAGDHALSASYAAQNNFNGSSATSNLHVNQAQATLSFDNLTFTYDGSPKPVSVTTAPANIGGSHDPYNGSATPPTNPGSTPVFFCLIDECELHRRADKRDGTSSAGVDDYQRRDHDVHSRHHWHV